MKKIFRTIIFFLYALLLKVNVSSQSCNCIDLDSSQSRLYLNGNNFTLIDNALRCFKLSSIAGVKDSLVRIWVLEDDFPDRPTTWRVKMFEFGKKREVPFATLHVLEWGYESDSSLPVKCIKHIKLPPEKGWPAFERDIRVLNLSKLYKEPYKGFWGADYGMLIIQFLFEQTTHTVDVEFANTEYRHINTLQYEHTKRVAYLFWAIEKHFSINLAVDSKGRVQYLEGAMEHFKLKK
jgi:hypothetical protein